MTLKSIFCVVIGFCSLLRSSNAQTSLSKTVSPPQIDLHDLINNDHSPILHSIVFSENYDASGNVSEVSILERDLKNHILSFSTYDGDIGVANLVKNPALIYQIKPSPFLSWIYHDNSVYIKEGRAAFWKPEADFSKLGNYLLPFINNDALNENVLFQGYARAYARRLARFAASGDSAQMAETLNAIHNMDPSIHPDGKITIKDGTALFTFIVDANKNLSSVDINYGLRFHTKITNLFADCNLQDVWNSATKTQKFFGNAPSLDANYNRNFAKDTPVFGMGLDHLGNKIIASKLLGKSPARLAGIEEGDEILTINGTDVSTLNTADLMDLMDKAETATIFFKNKNSEVKHVEIAKVPLKQAEGTP